MSVCPEVGSCHAQIGEGTPGCIKQFGQRCLKKYSNGVCSLRSKVLLNRNLKEHFIFENVQIVILLLGAQHITIVPNVGVLLGMDQLHEVEIKYFTI